MSLIVDKCFTLRCNATVNNPLHPQCEMRSEAVYNDREALVLLAKQAGWTEKGDKDYCPAHPQVVDAVIKPAPKPRAPKVAPVINNHGTEGQQ